MASERHFYWRSLIAGGWVVERSPAANCVGYQRPRVVATCATEDEAAALVEALDGAEADR